MYIAVPEPSVESQSARTKGKRKKISKSDIRGPSNFGYVHNYQLNVKSCILGC